MRADSGVEISAPVARIMDCGGFTAGHGTIREAIGGAGGEPDGSGTPVA